MTPRTRSVAFYLPQFHPIPENDRWWGAGFTEWRNTAKARPLFAGHEQPHVPGELGYYDLRSRVTREAQADLARSHGIDAFCYYHYWFDGRRLLERPFDEVLRSGAPTLPFCLCWANESWTRAWDGSNRSVLIAQRHSAADDLAHIRHLAPALAEPRYLRIEDRPLLLVYRASTLPDPRRTTDLWRDEARRLGVGDLHLARVESLSNERGDPRALGFDTAVEFQPDWRRLRASPMQRAIQRSARALGTTRFDAPFIRLEYSKLVDAASGAPLPGYTRFPCVTPGFDNTPRRARGAVVLTNSSPRLYGDWVARTLRTQEPELLFVNAWNEWGEGAHLEPCERWGRAYLEAHRDAVARSSLTAS
jgi:lipopolysaccharide biosynthesis protein